jgi:two-component system phosphate regulon sensor histidine kinase PhoR
MNQRAIWTIIALMSVGLIGTAVIQIYWFRSAIQLQESRFDANVFDALNTVRERLQNIEKNQLDVLKSLSSSSTRTSPFIQRETRQFLKESEMKSSELKPKYYGHNDTLLNNESVASLLSNPNEWLRRRNYTELQLQERELNPPELDERINLRLLSDMVHKELADKGIDIYFDHGVYANAKEGFIAINDNYVIPAVDSNMSQPPVAPGGMTDHNTLFNSPYQVMLFPRDIHDSPGSLIVYFPNKRTWVWSSFIPTLLGTIVFTGLILFCFSYTIWVIFRQKKISEMKTDFINNMTHEFKTPIATISLAADSIVSPMVIDSHEKIERFSGIIKQENKRMLSQVEKVLQMALIDKRDFHLKLSDVNMHDVINQAIENVDLQVQRRGGQIIKTLEATEPVIQGDATHLSSVIHNLLDNANKYSPDTPEISVVTRNVESGLEVIVQDKGIGMTKEVRKLIF